MSEHQPDPSFRGPDAPITTYMADEVVTVGPDATLRRAAEVIAEASIGCIVVGTVDEAEGVLSERDVVRAIAEGRDPDTTTVAEIESTRLVWATTDATIASVANEMMEDYVRHVLVGDDGTVAGIVSMRDVITAYLS
jgi:CBS domain-containing protein